MSSGSSWLLVRARLDGHPRKYSRSLVVCSALPPLSRPVILESGLPATGPGYPRAPALPLPTLPVTHILRPRCLCSRRPPPSHRFPWGGAEPWGLERDLSEWSGRGWGRVRREGGGLELTVGLVSVQETRRWREKQNLEDLAPEFGTREEGEETDLAKTLVPVPLGVRMGPDTNLSVRTKLQIAFVALFLKTRLEV